MACSKQKRLVKNLIGDPSVIDDGAEQCGRSKTLTSTFEVSAATAKIRMIQLSDEINSIFSCVPQASVKVCVEISADFPQGDTHQFILAGYENLTDLSL